MHYSCEFLWVYTASDDKLKGKTQIKRRAWRNIARQKNKAEAGASTQVHLMLQVSHASTVPEECLC